LSDDVLSQPGATGVIVLEGINDIGMSEAPASDVIDGLQQIVVTLHAHGLRVLLGTLTPSVGFVLPTYSEPQAIAARDQVNGWIRTSGVADGIVDFDAVVRDPSDPTRLDSRYDSGDHLH